MLNGGGKTPPGYTCTTGSCWTLPSCWILKLGSSMIFYFWSISYYKWSKKVKKIRVQHISLKKVPLPQLGQKNYYDIWIHHTCRECEYEVRFCGRVVEGVFFKADVLDTNFFHFFALFIVENWQKKIMVNPGHEGRVQHKPVVQVRLAGVRKTRLKFVCIKIVTK